MKEGTLVIRLIRSFPHRNIRPLVIRDLDFESLSVQDLVDVIRILIQKDSSLPPPFKNFEFDTLKIEHIAFGSKSNNPVINTENDEELILSDLRQSLKDNHHIRNETEISFFKMSDYLEYKENPTTVWN